MSGIQVTGAGMDPLGFRERAGVSPSSNEPPPPTPPQEPTPPPTGAPGSIIAGLRSRAQDQQIVPTKAFIVGGEFGDMLQIRYKPLGTDELDNFLASISEVNMQRAIQMNMDMMAKSCVGVEGYDATTDTREPLLYEGQPVYLDNRLAIVLDFPNPSGLPYSSHDVIRLCFGNNGLMIGAHGDRVTEWMRDPKGSGTPTPTSGS